MFELYSLGDERKLPQQLSAIEDFYHAKVIQHKIPQDGLELSAIESTPDHYESTILIIPGRAENEHKYAELLYHLSNYPIRVLICFVRGQGFGTRIIPGTQKCHIESFDLYRSDVARAVEYFKLTDFSLLGFSMGGLVSLDYTVSSPAVRPQRLCLIAPYLWPYFRLPESVLKAALSIANTICPLSYTPHGSEYQRVAFEENHHSHSELRYKLYHDWYADHPDEALAGPSFRFVYAAMKKQIDLRNRDFQFDLPVLCFAAGDDQVVSSEVTRNFFREHAKDRVNPAFRWIEEAFHDILNESDCYRAFVLQEAFNFLTGNN